MKKLSIAILALLMVGTTMVSAQEVNTMYFLENRTFGPACAGFGGTTSRLGSYSETVL